MNLVLVSRNPEKLKLVANEIYLKYPNTKIITKAVDFLDSKNPYFYEQFESLKSVDVSILVNNIGADGFGVFS